MITSRSPKPLGQPCLSRPWLQRMPRIPLFPAFVFESPISGRSPCQDHRYRCDLCVENSSVLRSCSGLSSASAAEVFVACHVLGLAALSNTWTTEPRLPPHRPFRFLNQPFPFFAYFSSFFFEVFLVFSDWLSSRASDKFDENKRITSTWLWGPVRKSGEQFILQHWEHWFNEFIRNFTTYTRRLWRPRNSPVFLSEYFLT